jgi:hypothetical protein
MKKVRLVALLLFYATRILAIVAIVVAVYVMLVLLFSKFTNASWLPIDVNEHNMFVVFYPITKTPFFIGEYTGTFLITNLSTMCFYGLFLWSLSDVFNAFRQQRLFSEKGLLRLSRFYLINLTLPLVLLLLVALFGEEVQDIIRITFLHMIIGVFAFFMAAIFKQGLLLQEEQDLIF